MLLFQKEETTEKGVGEEEAEEKEMGGSRSAPWGGKSLILKAQLSNVHGSEARKTN